MKRKLFFAVITLISLFSEVHAQSDTIINRYREYLIKSVEPEGNTDKLVSSFSANGQWPDINYNDTERAGWQLLNHLKRVRDLALVWINPRSSYYHKKEVWLVINKGLDHWLDKRYKNSNWWHNEIGVPQYMRDIIILVKAELSAGQFSKALEVLAQHHVLGSGAGANLTWSADLGFHYGALTNDKALMQKCLGLLVGEIRITTGEGVQPDYSFHQHGAHLQMYQYGQAYLWENTRLAWELRGTEFAYPEEKIRILTDFTLSGWQWMARGVNTVPGTMDRSASRKDALRSADIRKLIPYLIVLSPGKTKELQSVAAIQNGRGALSGFRYYPYSDFAAYQQKDFSFFVKTISARTLPSESFNNENLKGHLLNSGDAYLIRDGNEYFNLMPGWNWEYLPGITSFDGAVKITRKPLSGGVSDGAYGFTVMDYQLEGKEKGQMLSARKFWAGYGKQVICLVAGLKAENIAGAYSVLDQCRWRGDVTVNKAGNVLKEGDNNLQSVKWIHHAGFAYIPLVHAPVDIRLNTTKGTWQSINASTVSPPVEEKVFMPVIKLQDLLKEQSFGYVLAACRTPQDADKLAGRPEWKVLRNDNDCQAVSFKDGTLMAAFYTGTSLDGGRNKQLKADKPCLILVSKNKVYVSDPLHKGGTVKIELNNKVMSLEMPSDGGISLQKF